MAKTIEEKIAVMQHYADGGKVENKEGHVFQEGLWNVAFNWAISDYSIVFLPKEYWLISHPKWQKEVRPVVYYDATSAAGYCYQGEHPTGEYNITHVREVGNA